MRMRCRHFVSSSLLCLLTLIVTTATPATARAADISQFINEQTVFAGEADLTKLDAAAIEATLMELAKAAGITGPDALQMKEAEAKANIGVATKWIDDVKQAGAKSIYLVMDSTGMERYGPTVIIPATDAQAPAIAKLVPIQPPPPGQPGGPHRPQVTTIPGVGVMFGATANVTRMKNFKPAPRADLAAGFKSAGAAPIKLAFALDTRTREQITKNAPPMILGKPTTLITKDFQWAGAAVTPPPNLSVKALAQSTDANTAKQTDELIVSAILMNQKSGNKLPDELITLLTPRVQGSQLVLALDAKQINQVAVAMREPLMRGRQAALRVQSASNIRQILQSCLLYANENKGQYPADMKELEKAMAQWMPEPAMVKRVLTNPRQPDVKPAYVYIKPAEGVKAPAETVVIYESHKDFGDGINVGFADGHVEFVNRREQFDQMLAKTAQQQ